MTRIVLTLAPALLALAYAATLRTAAAQPAPVDEALVEALARVAVAESGWDPATGDASAIARVLIRRAARRDLPPLVLVRAYCDLHFDRSRRDPRRWIADLELDAHRPRGWPAGLAWSRYRPLWLAMLEHIRGVLRGEVADPCGGRGDHFGSHLDDWRARRAGWTRVDCGGVTRTHVWAIAGGET